MPSVAADSSVAARPAGRASRLRCGAAGRPLRAGAAATAAEGPTLVVKKSLHQARGGLQELRT